MPVFSSNFRHAERGAVTGAVAAILVITAIAASATYFFYCPCDRTPGVWLSGDEVTEPVSDWSFANDVPLCQIEVQALLPHSVNLNCMSSNGQLYLSCSGCEGKYWSSAALANPHGRIRIDNLVYPVTLTRVENPATLDEAWVARITKLGRGQATRPDHWWSFELTSR